MCVDELKKFLTARGIPCSGKKKEELVFLAERGKDKYEVLETCDHDESERKRKRVVGDDGNTVDLNGLKVSHATDLRGAPQISLGDVFAYLVKHCEWTPERLSNYRNDDGYLMFRDSHVEDVLLGKISNHSNHVYIKASVKLEQRQIAQRYQTWVLLSVNCGIKSAGCGCVAADDGSCKHAVAVLFALADYFERNTDKGTAVGTDEPCTWTKPRKASLPVKVEDLDYRAERKTPRKPGPLPKHYKPLSNVTNSCILNIQEHVKKVCEDFHPGALYLKLVQEPPPPVKALVPSVSDLRAKYQASSTDNVSFIDYLRQNTSKQQIDILRNLDQSDPAWLAARKGRITASLADSIRSVRDVHNRRTLVDKIMGTSKPFQSSSTEFGKENEHVARQLYVVDEMKSHKNFKVNTCGLVLDDNMPFMGASPDGIVSCTCHGEKLLEIKCSFKHRDIDVEDIPTKDPAYHLKAVNGQLQLKKSSSWYSQIQFQLGVTRMNLCDLVVYTHKGIKAIPVKFDPEPWELLKKESRTCVSQCCDV